MSKKVYFVACAAARPGLLGVVAHLHEAIEADVEYSRIYTINAGHWRHIDLDFEARSIAYTSPPWSWWILGKRGEVAIVSANGTTYERIADAGTGNKKLGYLNQIRLIDNRIFVCGYRRQIYCREKERWIHFDQGILADKVERGKGLLGMCGKTWDNLYVVGRDGEIFHFDGNDWSNLNSPTNLTLEACCTSRTNDIFVCGNKGLILRGNHQGWMLIDPAGFSENLWDIIEYQGETISAHRSGLVKVRKDKVEPWEGLPPNTTTARLAVIGDQLWSVGNYHIQMYDGVKWHGFPCPDNT